MNREAGLRYAVIFVFLLALVAVGCQRANVEKAAAVDEAEPGGGPATTDAAKAGTTAAVKRGVEARAGDGVAVANSGEAEAYAGNGVARAGDAVAGNGKARAGGGEAAVRKDAGARPGKVELKIGGRPGAEFSGTCAIGDEEREVSGRVPGRFVYEPEGRKLACEIHNGGPDAGPLKFSVTAGAENKKQKAEVTGDTISLSFSGSGITYSTSSASGNAVQKSSIRSSSYSKSSVSSSSGSR